MNPLLKCREVGEILNISKAYVYRLVVEGKIPHIQIGRSVRVRYDDLVVFLENNYITADDDNQTQSI